MDEMETDDPVEADISVKTGKRDLFESQDVEAYDKEHVVKKQKLSVDADLVKNEVAKNFSGEVASVEDGKGETRQTENDSVNHHDGGVANVPPVVLTDLDGFCNDSGDPANRKAQEVSVIVLNVSSENKGAMKTPSDGSIGHLTSVDGMSTEDTKKENQIKVVHDNRAEKADEQEALNTDDADFKNLSVIRGGGSDATVCVATDKVKENVLNCSKEACNDVNLTHQEVVMDNVKSTVAAEANTRTVLSDGVICNVGAAKQDLTIVGTISTDGATRFSNNEKEVGITEFVSPVGSMRGIIKQRYSDFIVNELNLTGQVVELTTKEVPQEAACECPDVSDLLGEDIQQRLDGLQNDKNLEKVLIPVDNFTKEDRRKIHQFIRAKYSRLLSTTEDVESQKFVIVTHGAKDQTRQGKNRKQTSWPPDRGNYTQFVLHKENIDTMEAINILSKYLKINPGSFTYAGTKDKRAVTSQLVTVYRAVAEKLAGLNRVLRNITLGNFQYVKSPLRLGDLSGNRFKIVLRKIDGDSASINSYMTSLAEKGFVNYFGMQRFGTTAIPTYHIGRALLQGDWKNAIELILKPRDGDDANFAECRKLWWDTRNASAALAKLHRKNSVEGQLLYGLESHGPNDLVNAINCVPRNTRMMYTHSYQSYVWNRVVSRRLQKYQFSVIEGDLVDANPAMESGVQLVEKLVPHVYKASESEPVPDITTIVMPLPGYDVVYPNNEIADWYREVMIADGLDIDNMKHRVQSYSLSGDYRRLLVKPTDVSWKVVKYDDLNIPLLTSDLDVLNGKQELAENQNGSLAALKMEFSLPPSSYATMALREVMKVDTSVAFQSTLK